MQHLGKDKIEKVRYKVDDRVALVKDGQDVSIQDALSDLTLEELSF